MNSLVSPPRSCPGILALLFAAAAGGCTGCGGGASHDSGPPVDAPISPSCLEAENHSDYEWIEENIFNRSCANFTSCHDRAQPEAHLDMTPGTAYGELVNVPSFYFADWLRVKPGDPEASYLMVRMRCHSDSMPMGESCATGPLDGGDLMPPNSNPLCRQKIEAVRRWIAAGAKEFDVDAGIPDAGAPIIDAAPPIVDAAAPDAP